MHQNIMPLSAVRLTDHSRVGYKTAVLGEITTHLSELDIQVPRGFVISTVGFRAYCHQNRLNDKIEAALARINYQNPYSLKQASDSIRNEILQGHFPHPLNTEIRSAYRELIDKDVLATVAVKSSSTIKTKEGSNFTGEQCGYLAIRGEEDLLDTIRDCFASQFVPRSINYREAYGCDTQVNVAIGILLNPPQNLSILYNKLEETDTLEASDNGAQFSSTKQLIDQLIMFTKMLGLVATKDGLDFSGVPDIKGFMLSSGINAGSITPKVMHNITRWNYILGNVERHTISDERTLKTDLMEYFQALTKEAKRGRHKRHRH
ncbi:PEP/pyruvate-binding domain-containing protein [Chitinophaga sp. MM2321]|uniref:PEP/pyruvate-binding domain-containing protein n=1 Tax=Chitinophaga sp. MM2321 TaxID=3137178 RepID=UPI0032D57CEE